MMSVPATIASEIALNRQNVALSVIKQNADQDQAIASILEEAISTAPVSSTRGTSVNISA